jgi:AcrR family transcriptional regulator
MTGNHEVVLLPVGFDSTAHQKMAELIAASYRSTGKATAAATGSRHIPVQDWVTIATAVARHMGRPSKDLGHVIEIADWPATGPERLIDHANLTGATTAPQPPSSVMVSPVPVDPAPHSKADTALTARDRVLATASQLFTRGGIRAVGVQDILEHAGVNRAAFYRHFPTRGDVEVEYVRGLCAASTATLTALHLKAASPRAVLTALIDGALDLVQSEDFRGDQLVNAAAEFPDRAHPVRQLILQHHTWYHAQLMALFRDARHADPDFAAARFTAAMRGAVMAALTGSGTVPAHTLRDVMASTLP